MADSVEVQEGEQSFAAIQKPHEADGEDQLILLWGRFWSDSESKAGAFYNQFNSDQHNIGDLRFVLHEDRSRLDPYDPDQSPTEMKNSLPSDPETGAGIPGAETQMFEQAVRKSLNDREKLKSLKTC